MRSILPSNMLWVKDARSQEADGRSRRQEHDIFHFPFLICHGTFIGHSPFVADHVTPEGSTDQEDFNNQMRNGKWKMENVVLLPSASCRLLLPPCIGVLLIDRNQLS